MGFFSSDKEVENKQYITQTTQTAQDGSEIIGGSRFGAVHFAPFLVEGGGSSAVDAGKYLLAGVAVSFAVAWVMWGRK